MKNKNFIRIIPKLDIKNGTLIKGINLEGLRVLGDPYNFAKHYYKNGADEICYIDNVATLYGTNNLGKFISKTAENLFIPLTVGGGIKTINDIQRTLKLGADKVCINSAAVNNIKLIKSASRIYGSSTITSLVEIIKIKKRYYISTSNGRDIVNLDPVKWCRLVEKNGAGEIFLTCVNNEGLKKGFDTNIIRKISNSVKIPVIAHGGAGKFEDILNVINKTKISGVALASMLHYSIANKFNFKNSNIGNTFYLENNSNKTDLNVLKKLKQFLYKNGVNVRI